MIKLFFFRLRHTTQRRTCLAMHSSTFWRKSWMSRLSILCCSNISSSVSKSSKNSMFESFSWKRDRFFSKKKEIKILTILVLTHSMHSSTRLKVDCLKIQIFNLLFTFKSRTWYPPVCWRFPCGGCRCGRPIWRESGSSDGPNRRYVSGVDRTLCKWLFLQFSRKIVKKINLRIVC